MVTLAYDPYTQETEVEDHEFEASKGYVISSRPAWSP
jgi:hypothetical protein